MKTKDAKKIEKIYSATLQLVKDNGLTGISINKIAEIAGFSAGTVYIYFENKDDLIAKLFDHCLADYFKQYLKDQDGTLPIEQSFRIMCNNFLDYVAHNHNATVFVQQCFRSPFVSMERRQSLIAAVQPHLDLLQKGMDEKLIKSMDPRWMLLMIEGLIREGVKYAEYYHVELDEKAKKDIVDFCWNGARMQ